MFSRESVDRDWLMAFTGLFMADGCVTVIVRKGTVGEVFSPRAELRQRADNGDLVRDLQAKLGGRVSYRKATGTSRPGVAWTLGGKDVAALCELLLTCPLPAKKKQEAQMVLDFIRWRQSQPWVKFDRAEARRRVDELKAFRAFKELDG